MFFSDPGDITNFIRFPKVKVILMGDYTKTDNTKAELSLSYQSRHILPYCYTKTERLFTPNYKDI